MTKPARLPNGAPRALKDFVACTTSSVELDLTDLGWVPRPDEVPDALEPSVTIADGSTSSSATIKVGYGPFIALELPASIVDGQLRIDAGDLPFGIGPNVTKWVDDFNATLRANDKQLDTFSVNNGKITITKKALVAAPDTSSIAPAGSATAVPTPDSDEKEGSNSGCLAWIVGAVAAVVAAVGIGVVATRGGDDAPETADSIATESPATDPPATDAPRETDPPPTTSTTTTTVAQVGQVPIDDELGRTGLALLCIVDGPLAPVTGHGDIEVPDGNCQPADEPTDTYSGCDPVQFPCSTGQLPPLVVSGITGNNHVAGTPDAVTGVPGASTLFELLIVLIDDVIFDDEEPVSPYPIEASADCAGSTVTGAAETGPDGSARVASPLYSYGTCSERELRLTVDGFTYRYPQVAEYVVDASERDPITPDADAYAIGQPFDPTIGFADLSNDLNTVNNVIGGRPGVDDGCFWFFEPQNVEAVTRVLDGCAVNDHFWVFAAATTNVEFEITVTDSVMGTTATYANPLGQLAPTLLDTSAFDASGTLADNSVFPCGFGFVAYTACTEDAPPMDAGAFVTVSAAMGGPIPLESDGTARAHHVDFAASGGGRFSVAQDGDEWVVTSAAGATRTRAIIRGNSVTFVVPSDELPEGSLSYQWTSEVDGNVTEQPAIPVVGVIAVPATAAEPDSEPAPEDEPAPDPDTPTEEVAPSESLADFYAQLSASVSAGDLGFALDRLDPRVFEVYPDSCPAALERFADPDLVIEFISAGPIEDWVYEANEQAIDVPDSQAVTIRLTGRGQSGDESVAHLALVDGQYRWFTFC